MRRFTFLFQTLLLVNFFHVSLFANVNLAFGKFANQSSTFTKDGHFYIASNANDGYFGTNLTLCSVTLTESRPWLNVILDKPTIIRQIRVLDASELIYELKNFYIKTRLVADSLLRINNDYGFKHFDYLLHSTSVSSTKSFTPLHLHYANFVRFEIHTVYALALCEVEIWSMKRITKNKIAQQSSTKNDSLQFNAALAFDDQINIIGDLNANKCSQTKFELNPWWKIDLLKNYTIFAISIIGEINNNQNQSTLSIHLSDSNDIPSTNQTPNCASVEMSFTYKTIHCLQWTIGRYLLLMKVSFPNKTSLVLREVDIFGYEIDNEIKIVPVIYLPTEYITKPMIKTKDCLGIVREKVFIDKLNTTFTKLEMKGVGLKFECENKIFTVSISFKENSEDVNPCEISRIEQGYFTSSDLFDTCYIKCENPKEEIIHSISIYHQENMNEIYSKEIFLIINYLNY